ncbi:NAD(P)H-hydrate dehydratase [Nocardioides sp.]|uniref:NAD(P)H-hydrate dehydratase n=1 Tax=Nocardioides sp. TaxID=35761 RepID=UPI002735CC23|nr:NAD(P)H-hydrate dehydratase [Nocardioides sp.]MDP3889903.1 NAD(P)H-hydrate dehydratase [Nocardioides sp.]
MRQAHTVEQVRAAEAGPLAVLPEGALMLRAATGLAHAVIDLLGSAYGRRVTLLVGPGDNGGDTLTAGALLARRGCAVEAVLLADRAHEAGLVALRAAGGTVTRTPGRPTDVLVDGIVGIGGHPGLRDNAVAALAAYDAVPVVAVDVPSGVDVDTGRLAGPHVTADLTVTFGTHKIAHLVDPAAAACGAVHLVDIGLDLPAAGVESLQPADVAALLPVPDGVDHKYTRGVVGVRAGSTLYAGAAVLCVAGAASGLAGMVRYDGPDRVADLVRAAHPEVVAGPGRVQAWVVGSGGSETAADALARSLGDGVPLVVDADALQHLDRPVGVPAILTPHAGELARMLGVERSEVEADQLAHARRAAQEYAAVVMLKGRHTLTAAPDGRVRVTTTGLPWLATAGAGDVLAGLTGALLAGGLDTFDAASVGSWLHGAAATHAARGGPVTAGAVAATLPAAVRLVLGVT